MQNIDELYKDLKFSGILMVKYGKEEFKEGKDELFHLGKISALVYKYLAVALHKNKKIDIFEKISKYDAKLPVYIRIYDLLLQVAGVNEIAYMMNFDREREYSMEDFIKIIHENTYKIFDGLNYGKFLNSSTNFIILAYVLELATEENIYDLIKENVIEAMGLENCHIVGETESAEEVTKSLPTFICKNYHGFNIIMDCDSLYNFICGIKKGLKSKKILNIFNEIVDDPKNILTKNVAIVGQVDESPSTKNQFVSYESYYDNEVNPELGKLYSKKAFITFDINDPKKNIVIAFDKNYDKDKESRLSDLIMMAIDAGKEFFITPKKIVLDSKIREKIIGRYVNERTFYDIYVDDSADAKKLMMMTRQFRVELKYLESNEENGKKIHTFFRNNFSIVNFIVGKEEGEERIYAETVYIAYGSAKILKSPNQPKVEDLGIE